MKDYEIQVDEDTSSLLAALAEAEDDPLAIAKVAQIDPTEFREFISECGEAGASDATMLLNAAESLHRGRMQRYDGSDRTSSPITSRRIGASHASPYRFIIPLYLGLAISLAYCLTGSALLWYLLDGAEAQLFFAAYVTSFKTIISLGLILGTALIAYQGQNIVTHTIESAYGAQLPNDYYYYKRRSLSFRVSITFSAQFIVLAFVIFSNSQFPLSKLGAVLMVIAVCGEYALAMYVVRKLFYAVLMLRTLLAMPVTRSLFRRRALDSINPYLHTLSMLTVIFFCVHVIDYYNGPFLYGGILKENIRPFLLLPAVLATLVLLFGSFYVRDVLHRIYDQSIDFDVKRIRRALRSAAMSDYEKRSYLIEVDKNARTELRDRLKSLTLNDLPLWITILITILGPFLLR